MNEDLQPSETWIDRFRGYLRLLARTDVGTQLQSKLDPSDIVQQTMLQAHRALPEFQGTTDAERAAWLRTILVRTMAHATRDFHREKRDVRRERSLEAAIEQSSAKLDAWLAAGDSSPSQKASRIEDVVRLAQALEQLPEAQRIAIERQYFDGQSLEQIGHHLGRSGAAVAGLLRRGLQTLKMKLAEDSNERKMD